MSGDMTRARGSGLVSKERAAARALEARSAGEGSVGVTYKAVWSIAILFVFFLATPFMARAQQLLGSINGTVTDTSGAVMPGVSVQVKNLETNLSQSTRTQRTGAYNISDLPAGTYSVTLSKTGFKSVVYTQILVQANRAATVNAALSPGEISTQVTVSATPLLDQTDTTNGYVLPSSVIESTPLGTGSFTQLATLSPGVNADLLSGSGTNTGLGNQNIWANGQRDTSNSLSANGVSVNNLFNGKTSSQVASNRFTLNTGESFLAGGQIFTGTSVYDAIGEAIPSPPQETIQEMRVNTSMYDASQGAYSGAHIALITKSGTNNFHGQFYEYHQTTGWNANSFFFNANNIPRQALHRNTFGGTFGGPILHNKLFFFGSYQGQRVADQTLGISDAALPPDLTNDRSAGGLATMLNTDFGSVCGPAQDQACTASDINPVALAIMQAKAPSGSGYLIATPNNPTAFQNGQGFNTVIAGPASRFTADQANANIDYVFGPRNRLAAKYYYQRDPTTNPFAESQFLGATQQLLAGSQVFSLADTAVVSPSASWENRIGFVRETAYATAGQALTPSGVGMNLFGSNYFPSIYISNADTQGDSVTIGPLDNFADAGVYQNNWELSSHYTWLAGINTFYFGFNGEYSQLNVLNKQNQVAALTFDDFSTFLTGNLKPGIGNSTYFDGSSNRYFRAKQVGFFVQDNIKLRPNLTVDAGLRWDWDGPLVEKNGMLTNFFPQDYSYNLSSDTVSNIGLVVAGNNSTFGTKGVSNSTLSGRQWMIEPRIGLAWSPSFVKNLVVRAGFGLYADRGEYFTEFSPSAGFGFNGPFGVTLEPPFVVPVSAQSSCVTDPSTPGCSTFQNPFGTSAPPPPPSNLSQVAALVPCQGLNSAGTCSSPEAGGITIPGLIQGSTPFLFGGYDPRNTLPYSENWTLDLQWQPYNTLLVDVGYVGTHGLHETLPIPFNMPRIATPQTPVNGQTASYGYQVPGFDGEPYNTSTGGNTDLRVPYIGYSPNSVFYEAEGISHYNALQLGVQKRMSHGLLVAGSYTWSHSLDEGSGLQLFYNGNNPLDPRSGYGNSGFDRTHVLTVSYRYEFPSLVRSSSFGRTALDGWGISGITVAQSGQPYSVVDYSGGVGSIYFSVNDYITNPIVPVGGTGSTSNNAVLQGTTGVNPANPVLNVNAFGVPLIAPGQMGVPACDATGCDTFETGFGTTGRNIFRGPFQTRFDFGVFKNFRLTERFSLRYDAQFFNLFNHPSFDTPNNDVAFNPYYANPPLNINNFNNGYTYPPTGHLGIIRHTLGSARFIQMSLHLIF